MANPSRARTCTCSRLGPESNVMCKTRGSAENVAMSGLEHLGARMPVGRNVFPCFQGPGSIEAVHAAVLRLVPQKWGLVARKSDVGSDEATRRLVAHATGRIVPEMDLGPAGWVRAPPPDASCRKELEGRLPPLASVNAEWRVSVR